MSLTDDELRVRIAEACGWAQHMVGDFSYIGWLPPSGEYRKSLWRTYYLEKELPNYPGDLQAMHEAEKTLNATQLHAFNHALDRVIAKDDKDEHWSPTRTADSYKWHATARQRALAFVATIEKI
jgi:hypothetical protein